MARRLSTYLVAFAGGAAAAAECEVLRSLEFQQHTAPKGVSELLGPVMSLVSEKADSVGDINRERRHGARKPDAAATGAQGRLLPVPSAGRLGEGAVPVAIRFADDLRLKLSPDAFAAYLRLLAHASRRTPPPRRDQL